MHSFPLGQTNRVLTQEGLPRALIRGCHRNLCRSSRLTSRSRCQKFLGEFPRVASRVPRTLLKVAGSHSSVPALRATSGHLVEEERLRSAPALAGGPSPVQPASSALRRKSALEEPRVKSSVSNSWLAAMFTLYSSTSPDGSHPPVR